MNKPVPFSKNSCLFLQISIAFSLSWPIVYSQNDGFLFEDLDQDLVEEAQSVSVDTGIAANEYIYFEDTTDEFLDGSAGAVIFPQKEESIVDIVGTDTNQVALDSSIVSKSEGTGQKLPFYKKWWFSLLFLIPAGYVITVFYTQRKKKWNSQIEYERSKHNTLEKTIQEKEDQILQREKEYREKLEEEENLKFQAVGLNKFSDIISGNKDELSKLGQQIITELVEYIGANAGVIYIVNDSDELCLNLLSAYAPDKTKLKEKISPGEGFVGACYAESKILEIDNVPETYTKIASGLGEALPKYLIFVPLVQDEQKLGVIEVAAFKKPETFKTEFISKLSERLASTIAIKQATDKMHVMLEQSKIHAEELRIQEEELRQNLEEMNATQEELNRQAEENKIIQEELQKENAFMAALMNNIPDYIYFKDLESKFTKCSLSLAKVFGFKNAKKLAGKTDFDFFSDEHAKPAFDAEQKIIKTGKPIVDLIEKEIRKDGTISWVSTTKLPLKDSQGKIIGTFGISRDVSKVMNLEEETREKNAQMLTQEEELRQNIEEMEAVQEELHRQRDELAKEQIFMETLLKNVKETIYFKDAESRFVKASDSMAKLFNVKSVEELYGKTDFDFFTEEHARPAFYDEMNIMKTKKAVFDKIEKETHPDGRITWVSTSKMPLLDGKGNAIGTFGISKDITHIRTMQDELRTDKAFLDALMNNLPDHIYLKDPEGKFIRISKSLLRLFPFDEPAQIAGKSDFDIRPAASAQKHYDEEMEIIRTGKGLIDHVEHQVSENGTEQWFSITKMPIYDDMGTCIGIVGISKDITPAKLLEKLTTEKKKK